MPDDLRNEPLPVFCFHVSLDFSGGSVAFFKSVSGLKYETEVIPVREGGANDTTFNLVGATKWAPIVLKQGYSGDSKLLEWRQQWLSTKPGTKNRSGGVITQLDGSLQPRASWTFFNGWPSKWEVSEFDAAKSELAIETLEIQIDGLEWKPIKAAGGRGARK